MSRIAASTTTSLVCKSKTEVVSWRRLTPPPPLHLPRVRERDGGGVSAMFNAATTSPPPSHARARGGVLVTFDAATASPTPSCPRTRRRWCFGDVRRRHHLSTSLALDAPQLRPPPPSHAIASQRWIPQLCKLAM
ncbi:hypothetical protein BDZ97DRAFT_1915675 [Flammula alnicola]|nr:hypothetical protein BDZ97DRAFT_1915675 [Flammula alnicola]